MAAAPTFSVVGQPVPRVEGPDKLTGAAQYTADFLLPGTLWGKNVRSPLAHARIVSIDTSRARAVPGVRAVLTAADIPNKRIGRSVRDSEILCSERVRYVGDVVAVIAADTQDAADEAALSVDVEYQELPAIFDAVAALRPGAPVIHPNARSYEGFPPDVPEELPNACSYLRIDRGDLEAGFSQADVVLEHTYTTQLMHQGYLEPHTCLVREGDDGRVEVWLSNKIPFALKQLLADILDRRPDEILVHRVNIGGEFGGKATWFDAPAAYFLARATGRPVKFVTSSADDLTAMTPRHPSVITIKAGAKRDGTLTAWDAHIVWNSGAYGGLKPPLFGGNLGGSNNAAGWFNVPNLHVDATMAYTNQVPCAYMRAPGQPQAVFAAEAHMDRLARELGIDRLEMRMRNLPDTLPNGDVSVAPQLLRRAAEEVGWGSPSGATPTGTSSHRLIGRGFGLGSRGTGSGPSTSDLTLNADGTLTAITSVPDNGTGGLTVVAQIVAETWGIPIDQVHLVHGDTDSVPVDVGSGGSSITNAAGHAAIAASEKLQEQLAPLAAAMLGTSEATYSDGNWHGGGSSLSLEEFAREMIVTGEERAHVQVTVTPERSTNQQFVAQAAEVEVDPETGQVQIRRLSTVQDVGTIINEIGHQGQIEGCVVQGVGFALMEELSVEEGRITTANFGDYKMPTIADVPALTTVNVVTVGPGPFSAKGIGETPVVPTAAAIANAVSEAIGVPVDDLPLTPERVLQAIDRA
jgi:carbon-monoxide dehydrogenase large subunit